MDRIKTGIDGLDEITSGGIPKGSFVVVTGGPGTGKTILASQFIANGISKFNEKCLFISVEQPAEEIKDQALQFGWDFQQMENEGKLKIVALNSEELVEMQTINEIKQLLQTNHYDRVVIDSVTSFIYSPISSSRIADGMEKGLQPQTFMELCRANATVLINMVKQMGLTTLGIAQKVEGMPGETVDNVSEFKGDGLIVMNYAAVGKTLNRTMQIKKLRKTNIDGIPHNFEFSENGISIMKSEEV